MGQSSGCGLSRLFRLDAGNEVLHPPAANWRRRLRADGQSGGAMIVAPSAPSSPIRRQWPDAQLVADATHADGLLGQDRNGRLFDLGIDNSGQIDGSVMHRNADQ